MAETPCPCKQKLTDGEKGILNFGLSSEMLKNPNAAAINMARQVGGSNVTRLNGLIDAAGATPLQGQLPPVLAQALPQLNQAKTKITQLQNTVTGFETECNRFTDPKQLVNIISSLSLYGELSCALGIEGLDIGGGLNVVNQNGQLSINYAVAANVDIENILNQFSDGSLGTDAAGAVQQLSERLNTAFQALDAANAAIGNVMAQASAIQNEAANFIQKYTSINSLANLVNEASTDPCFKIGSTLNGSLVSPQFIDVVRGNSIGFGTSSR